jgi:hypothetical protein
MIDNDIASHLKTWRRKKSHTIQWKLILLDIWCAPG